MVGELHRNNIYLLITVLVPTPPLQVVSKTPKLMCFASNHHSASGGVGLLSWIGFRPRRFGGFGFGGFGVLTSEELFLHVFTLKRSKQLVPR